MHYGWLQNDSLIKHEAAQTNSFTTHIQHLGVIGEMSLTHFILT